MEIKHALYEAPAAKVRELMSEDIICLSNGGDGQDGVNNEFGGAGIGSGSSGSCGDITISSGVTSLVATKGPNANCVGAGESATCGTVTIGNTVFWDGSAYQNDGETIITQSTWTYTPSIF